MYILKLPLSVPVSKNKKFILNINNYRNAHHHTLNKAKVEYKHLMTEQIEKLPRLYRILIRYYMYPGSSRRIDTANVCSIHDKFLSDAIVEAGKLEDDNYLFIPGTSYEIGSIDKDNPRVEAVITPLPPLKGE